MSTPVYFPAAGNAAIPAGRTSLAALMLARFDSAEIDLEWTTDGLSTVQFRARELPPELVPPAGETLGFYLGQLAPRAWLYTFIRDYGVATVVDRFTSYERDLVFAGDTFAAKKITHGAIKQGLALDRDELDLTVDGLDVVPLLAAATLRLEVPLILFIQAVEVTAPGVADNDTTIWGGEVSNARVLGQKITAKASPGGSRFDRKAPRFYLQTACNHTLYSPGCTLAKADWAHTATITDPGAAGFPYTFTLGSLARAGGAVLPAANAFAGGWLEIGTGTNIQRLPVLANTAPAGGVMVLTLGRDPVPFPTVGTAVTLFPGCDGRRETCQGFGNYLNFGGFPFVPATAPHLYKLKAHTQGAKK